jgi:REP element-mobilizing transposase RayT
VTARLQGRAAWFSGIEGAVASRIMAAPRRSDAAMLAYAVMPNHLHLVVVQGQQPLSQLMQPLLRRIVLLVQRRTGREGHIFERRFRTAPCLDADYLRNAIAYVHLNGLRAGLSSSVDQYEWCSHRAYLAPIDQISSSGESIERGLRVFAARESAPLDQCQADYRRFLEWRCAADAHRASQRDGLESGTLPERPITVGGDVHWVSSYPTLPIEQPPSRPRRPDLRDIAIATLRDVAPDMELEILRSGHRTKPLVAVRRRFILRASAAGHAGGVIARFLGITPTAVSNVRTAAANEGR